MRTCRLIVPSRLVKGNIVLQYTGGANQRYWLGASYSAGLRYPLRLRMRRPFWFCV
jgi:hypothetical protein